jgi:hypothetical protein
LEHDYFVLLMPELGEGFEEGGRFVKAVGEEEEQTAALEAGCHLAEGLG